MLWPGHRTAGRKYWIDVVAGKESFVPAMSLHCSRNSHKLLCEFWEHSTAAKTKHSKTFDTQLRIGVPSALTEATASAASERLESANDYVRRALLTQLKQDGFALPLRDGRAAA